MPGDCNTNRWPCKADPANDTVGKSGDSRASDTLVPVVSDRKTKPRIPKRIRGFCIIICSPSGLLYFILFLQRLPEHILEPGNVHTRYRGNEDRRNPLGQMAFHLFDQFLVEHIAFGDGQQALLVEQFRIILGQFAQQDRVILADVVAVTIDDTYMDEAGKFHLNDTGLITYSHGEYFGFGDKLGSFGYSVRKTKK